MNAEEKLQKCFESIRRKTDFVPEIGIILGTGLGSFADEIQTEKIVNYSELEYFPISTVSGHSGRFIFGKFMGKNIVIMQGRVHYYEGYDMTDVVLGVRIINLLGAKKLILTNAAGGINQNFSKGCIMAISDHISTFVPSPLRGKNIDMLGERFPDMSMVYDENLLNIAKSAAKKNNIDLKIGVYAQAQGPNYETPAEIRMFKALGADAVGMSTACEAMAAKHAGMNILGISCITNMAAGLNSEILSHTDVKQTAKNISGNFKTLLRAILEEI
ncbi:MAG: purine-nucleoside phosphorylase [Clostridia bacterium]|nr:purine-nucleoside phosphorylase [Clostridia bacterium]